MKLFKMLLRLSPTFLKRGCKIYHENVKLQIYEKGKYIYPDVVLTCDERDKILPFIIKYPSFIIEVLPKSTASNDKTTKFEFYRSLPSIQYYLTVESRWQSAELYSRTEKRTCGQFKSIPNPPKSSSFQNWISKSLFKTSTKDLVCPKNCLLFEMMTKNKQLLRGLFRVKQTSQY